MAKIPDYGRRPSRPTTQVTDTYKAPTKRSIVRAPEIDLIGQLSSTANAAFKLRDYKEAEVEKAAREAAAAEEKIYRDKQRALSASDRVERDRRRVLSDAAAVENKEYRDEMRQLAKEDRAAKEMDAIRRADKAIRDAEQKRAEKKGESLSNRLEAESNAAWAIAVAQDPDALLSDPQAREQFDATYLEDFVRRNEVTNNTVLRGIIGDGVREIKNGGEHRVAVIGYQKTIIVSEARDALFEAVGYNTQAQEQISKMSPREIHEAGKLLPELNDSYAAPIQTKVDGLPRSNFVDARPALREAANRKTAAQIQQTVDGAFEFNSATGKEVLEGMTEDFTELLIETNNYPDVVDVMSQIELKSGKYVSTAAVQAMYTANEPEIDANIRRNAKTSALELGVWESVNYLSPNTTLEQFEDVVAGIMNEDAFSEKEQVSLVKQARIQYEKGLVGRRKTVAKGKAVDTVLSGSSISNVSDETDIPEPQLTKMVEDRLYSTALVQSEDGTAIVDPALFASNAANADRVEGLPETTKEMQTLIGKFGTSNVNPLPEEEVIKITAIYKELASDKNNSTNLLNLTQEQHDGMNTLNYLIDVEGKTPTQAVAAMPSKFSFQGITPPSYAEINDVVDSYFDGYLPWAEEGDYDEDNLNSQLMSEIAIQATAAQLANPQWSKEAALEDTVKKVFNQGYIGLDGTVVRTPTGTTVTEIAVRDNFREINTTVKKQAFNQLQKDRKDFKDIYDAQYREWTIRESGNIPDPLVDVKLTDFLLPSTHIGIEEQGAAFFNAKGDIRGASVSAFKTKYGRYPLFTNPDLIDIDDAGDMPITIGSTTAVGVKPVYQMNDADGERIDWGINKFSNNYNVNQLWNLAGPNLNAMKQRVIDDRTEFMMELKPTHTRER